MTEPSFLRATREFYDTVAVDYTERLGDQLATQPLDRGMLAVFAELVRDAGPVADLGCGPGRVTAHLDALGVPVFGIDLSPRMVALARRAYPGLRFEEGAMTALDLPDGALGAIVAWYSVIHTPWERLPEVFAEFHRVLAPGGHLLLAFQVGDKQLRLDRPFGHPVSIDLYQLWPDHIAGLLSQAGLFTRARLLREPDENTKETTQHAYLLAHKTGSLKAPLPAHP